ncbi:MAG: cytochrome P450, partial [Acidimicrobiales bacterium]
MADVKAELYYDPYDFDIDADPYPVFGRLRDEAPLYYNEKLDFYAVSRFTDVETCSVDWQTFSSARGSVLEIIRSGMEVPKGMFIFEDPPLHNLHRRLMARVFTTRRVAVLEERMRSYCADALDPHRGGDGFDFVRDLGAELPMRVISDMLGIPEEDQVAVRDRFDEGLRIEEGVAPDGRAVVTRTDDMSNFAPYIEFRRQHPADDLMTDLIETSFVDESGMERLLDDEEVLNYAMLLAAAGNETTTKLIGWTGYLLGGHPDERRALVAEPALVPGAIEEILRYEAPSPVQARYVTRAVGLHGTTVPQGAILLMLNAAANRDERQFDDPDRLDVRRTIDHHVTFGFGLHFCMGAALARLEGRVALEEVLARFPDWEVDTDNCERVHTTTVRGWHRLP